MENKTNRSVSIIVDSGSDMLPQEAEKLDIILLALNVRFNDEEFEDGVTISRDEFYNRMTQMKQLPKTSLISTGRYQETFENEINKGNDVVCLTLSSKISGCYQSAIVASEDYQGKVFVVDTTHFCGSEYLLALRAVQLRKQGMSASEIVEQLNIEKKQVQIMAVFDTLEYLKKGGRISATAACIGNVLAIKPILTIAEGGVKILGKARGNKNSYSELAKYIKEAGTIDWNRPVLFSYSGNSNEKIAEFIQYSGELYEGHDVKSIPIARVGATIGTYSGPDAFAFSFFIK